MAHDKYYSKEIKQIEREQRAIGKLLYVPDEQKRNMQQCLQNKIAKIRRKKER